jgi:glutamate synthase domain-containing protein 3
MGQIEITKKPEPKAANVPALAIGKRFDSYGPESEKAQKKADVQQNQVLEQLKDAYRKVECRFPTDYCEIVDEPYQNALALISNLTYSAADVKDFTVAIAEFQEESDFSKKAGLFLSALINRGQDSQYVLITKHLSHPVHCLAYQNTKDMIIDGDVGNFFGSNFENGEARVKGNAGTNVGGHMIGGAIVIEGDVGFGLGMNLKGGSITVEGNAHHNIGYTMENGSITIRGKAGNNIGGWTKGGEIYLEGDYGDLGEWRKGIKIYHKGKLIAGE